MHLLQRILFFILLLFLTVSTPWYVSLGVLIMVLLFTGWIELLLIAIFIDLVAGAGFQLSAVPWATLSFGLIALSRIAVMPSLYRARSIHVV